MIKDASEEGGADPLTELTRIEVVENSFEELNSRVPIP
jgi:hypothetical protein